MLQYLAFRALAAVAPLPPPGLGYWLCDRVAELLYLLLPRRRTTVRRNLSVVLRGRNANLDALVRATFRQGLRYYYDTFRAPALTDKELASLATIRGWEHIERALSRGKGAIVFTAHFGSPALVAQLLAVRGFKVTTAAEPVRPQRLLDLMTRVRGSRGITLLPLNQRSARELAEVLRRNEVVGVVADRDIQGTGITVDLFGVPKNLPSGPVLLALRSGAPILPAFTYRREGNRLEGVIGEPVALERTGDLRRDVKINTQALARVLERAISEAPEQWIVFEPVWPERPAKVEAAS